MLNADSLMCCGRASTGGRVRTFNGRCVGSAQAVHECPGYRSGMHRRCPDNVGASNGKRPPPRESTPLHRVAWASNSRTVERLLRETGHADGRSAAIDDHGSNRAPYSKELSLPPFFAPAKEGGRPRGRNPRLRTAARPHRLRKRERLRRSPARRAATTRHHPDSLRHEEHSKARTSTPEDRELAAQTSRVSDPALRQNG